MYAGDVRAAALALVSAGRSPGSVAQELGLSRAAVRSWAHDPESLSPHRLKTCVRCLAVPSLPPAGPYAHLLGLYLGDGCISAQRKGVYTLRIACSDDYPRLIQECVDAVEAVHTGKVFRVASTGCTHVASSWKHWPCLFPQHGPGRKHPSADPPGGLAAADRA